MARERPAPPLSGPLQAAARRHRAGRARLWRALAAEGGLKALVGGADGTERLFFPVSLDPARENSLGQEGRSFLLVLSLRHGNTRNPVPIAARVFGLTSAQVQVLAFLGQGHAPDEFAARLRRDLVTYEICARIGLKLP